jgi:hypothetical protein
MISSPGLSTAKPKYQIRKPHFATVAGRKLLLSYLSFSDF